MQSRVDYLKRWAIVSILCTIIISSGCSTQPIDDSMSNTASTSSTSSRDGEQKESSSVDPDAETDSGLSILGGALPAIDYKTLADAELAFGEYFGFRNTINVSEEAYELIRMVIVDNEVVLGTYEGSTPETSLTVKLSKLKTAEQLREIYIPDGETSLHGSVQTKIETDTSVIKIDTVGDTVYIATVEHISGKNYSIYSANGVSTETLQTMLRELSDNLLLIGEGTPENEEVS